MALFRFSRLDYFSSQIARSVSTSHVIRNKEIKLNKVNDTLEISAEYTKSPRDALLLKEVKESEKKFCPKCTLGLNIKHTDVLILSQYLRSDGCMLPRRITGLCAVQQKNIGTMVAMAQKAGLMPNIAPAYSKRDPTKRYGWKKFNKYFDETTIKYARKQINLE